MQVTIVGVYDAYENAREAQDELAGSGFEEQELEPRGEAYVLKVVAPDGDRFSLANRVMSRHNAVAISARSERVDYLRIWKRVYERARRR
jgi:hypothetical protein